MVGPVSIAIGIRGPGISSFDFVGGWKWLDLSQFVVICQIAKKKVSDDCFVARKLLECGHQP